MLLNPKNPQFEIQTEELAAASRGAGQEVLVLKASTNPEIDAAFAALADRGAGAVIIGQDTFFTSQPAQFAALAKRYAIPVISPWRDHVAAGTLMSYGANITDAYRQAGIYTGRSPRGGARGPPTCRWCSRPNSELVINLKTAKALGLEIPPVLLSTADEVIE